MMLVTENINYKKKRVLNSPPLEGWPQHGVVNILTTVQSEVYKVVDKPILLTTINKQPIYRNFITNLPYNIKLKPLLKDKRKAGILSEVLFWQQVHKYKFHRIDFDRQRIIGNFIVDFYVKTLGLIIEIDGSSHNGKEAYDEERQLYLENLGLKVYRIKDKDVKTNIEFVMLELEKYIIEQFAASG